MRNKNIYSVTLFLFLLLLPSNLFARDYSFPSLNVKGVIEKDGSLIVEEKRTVNFDGEFSGLFQWINKQPGEEIVDIKISENNKDYNFNPTQEIGPAGTYFIIDEGNRTYVDWSFKANNETKEFILTYKIKNAVKLHKDVAELYYIFTGDEWDKSIGDFKGEVFFPENGEGEIRAWGHGPLNGNVTIHEGERVTWDIKDIPPQTLVAGRVTFPLSMVPDGKRITEENALDEILIEEENLANIANKERKSSLFSLILGVLAFIGGLIFSIFQWFKYGKESKGDFDGDYYRELPSDRPPVEVGYLYRFKQVDAIDITATILDFGRRGFLTIEEYVPEKKGFFKKTKKIDYRLILNNKDKEILTKHEIILRNFLFNDIGNGKEVSFEEIEEFSKKQKKEFVGFWEKWKESVETKLEKENLFEKTTSSEVFKRAIPGIILLLFPTVLFVFFSEAAILAGIGFTSAGFIYLISLASHRRRTEKGSSENNKWKAFRKFIKDFSNIKDEKIPSLVIWEHYLVYAITLGIAKEALKALEISYPSFTEDNYTFGQGWFIYNYSTASIGTFNQSLNNMTTSISQSVSSAVAASTGNYSSGSGGGGGFSGGGGGGASGGGGGGAR